MPAPVAVLALEPWAVQRTNINNLIVIVLPKEPRQVQLSNAGIKVTTLLLNVIGQ